MQRAVDPLINHAHIVGWTAQPELRTSYLTDSTLAVGLPFINTGIGTFTEDAVLAQSKQLPPFTMHLLSLLLASLSMVVPASLKGTLASDLDPHCFYDYNCAIAADSSPDMSACQHSVDTVCAYVSKVLPSTVDRIFLYTTTSRDTLDPLRDCQAVVRLSHQVHSLAEASCVRSFSTIQGCAQDTNQHYNASQVGGSINIDFCNDHRGRILNEGLTAFALGTPDVLHHPLHITPHSRQDGNRGEPDVFNTTEALTSGPREHVNLSPGLSTHPGGWKGCLLTLGEERCRRDWTDFGWAIPAA